MKDGFVDQLRRFYESHRRELYTYAVLLTGQRETAEDVIHTVFCNLLRRSRGPRELRPYVFRCIRNAALDEARRAQRTVQPGAIFAQPNGVPDDGLLIRLESALEGLSDDERECIVLKVYNGLTFREVAALRRVSINTAASWYRRGLAKLKAEMEAE